MSWVSVIGSVTEDGGPHDWSAARCLHCMEPSPGSGGQVRLHFRVTSRIQGPTCTQPLASPHPFSHPTPSAPRSTFSAGEIVGQVSSEMERRKVTFKVPGEDFFLAPSFQSACQMFPWFFESQNVGWGSRGPKNTAERPGRNFSFCRGSPSPLFHPSSGLLLTLWRARLLHLLERHS